MIRADNLSKYYGGKRALGPVSFEIGEGESVGFLGLNGAGKTTALRILACDLRPSSGAVSIGEVDAAARPREVTTKIGFLPEQPPLYGDMTVGDYLHFVARLRGVGRAGVARTVGRAAEVTQVDDVRGELIRHLSHGYRQRVGVAQAILHEPELLVLDEPTRGLDPVQIVEMRKLLRDLKDRHTILISSHILTEVSETCDRLLVLHGGSVIASGREEELAGELLGPTRVHLALRAPPARDDGEGRDDDGEGRDADDGDAQGEDGKAQGEDGAPQGGGAPDPLAVLEGAPGVQAAHELAHAGEGRRFELTLARDVRPDLLRALVGRGFDVLELSPAHRELETIFLGLVGGERGGERDGEGDGDALD